YCTNLYFGPDGVILGKHRKLKPTAAERVIWGEGQLPPPVFETDIGKLGGLVCWENMMPLARAALYEQGVEIYVAPTADNRETWQATIRHIACEGRCFVLACNQFLTKEMYPQELQSLPEMQNAPEPFCPGGSAIVDPMGNYLAGPLFGEEGILIAELDLDLLVKSRFDFDVAGHYARPDIFRLRVRGEIHC
ncbi:MAG: carbon-nitrogen hydrolase family protein, partial [bacterium]